jgi:aryl-alcohol dehydrogenase-like predicted oxidoreductase
MVARRLGADGPLVGPVGLGCMPMSWAYSEWTHDDDMSVAVIHSALDHGVTFFDTADVYGYGHNEELVGRALRKYRHEVTLATKVGLVAGGNDGSPEHIESSVDASLYRLGDDVIDLYYLHRVDPQVPLAESWGAMTTLVEKGKVRRIGLCGVSADTR